MKHPWLIFVVAIVLGVALVSTAVAQTDLTPTSVSSAFTYQGQLKNAGGPVNGSCDIAFRLYDDPDAGSLIGNPITSTVSIANGLFTHVLDFGADVFNGDARWLDLQVRCPANSGEFTPLVPRQALTPAPYAAYSLGPWSTVNGGVAYTGGNVGIGTTATNARLTVSGAGTYAASGAARFDLYNTTAGDGFLQHVLDDGTFQIANIGSSTTRLVIDNSGRVGIGKTSPGAMLDVLASGSEAGVYGTSTSGAGVVGRSDSNEGLYGESVSGDGVDGYSSTGYGVYGKSTSNYAGYFFGNVRILGTCCAAAANYSQIDHPLDPANQYLQQALIESPDMKTVFDGNVTTDAHGDATVVLPAYVEALDSDFRYQLTVIGQFAQAIVATRINGNRFSIKTDRPNVEVSWQVTGIRTDPYAAQHRIQVEVAKSASERGKYAHPEVYGLPETLGINYEKQRALEQHDPVGAK